MLWKWCSVEEKNVILPSHQETAWKLTKMLLLPVEKPVHCVTFLQKTSGTNCHVYYPQGIILVSPSGVTRKHWPPVHGPPLRTRSVDYPYGPLYGPPPKLNLKEKHRNKYFTYFLSTAIDHSCRNNFRALRWENVTDLSSVSGASYIIDIPHCHFFVTVTISIYEKLGNLREDSKFVLLWVHFLRHFVRPILPRVRELVPGF